MPQLAVKRLHPDAVVPRYAHSGPFGDLAADLFSIADAELPPGSTALVPTGLAFGFPDGYGALVEDRSGLAVRGITTLAGVIDTGYRGALKVVLLNTTAQTVSLPSGSRLWRVMTWMPRCEVLAVLGLRDSSGTARPVVRAFAVLA